MKLKNLKKGTYFVKKLIEYPTESQVWVKGEYNRSLKKYECYRFSDVCDTCYISGDKEVFTDMTF